MPSVIASGRAAARGSGPSEEAAPPRQERRLGYVPALDGVRGVAIALVVAFHAYHWPVGGFLGVHVFFVLSGFLITSLLLDEWTRTGRISLRSFYARRALRLVPALAVFVSLYLAVQTAREVITPDALALPAAAKGALAGAFYVSNIVQAAGTHFAVSVVHLWSLAAEEQFYVLWPVTLVGLLLLGARRRGFQAFLGIAIVLLVLHRLRLTLDGADWRRLYLAPDTTFDPLLIGCLTAVWFVSGRLPRPLRSRTFLTVLGVIAAVGGAVVALTLGNQDRELYLGPLTAFAAAVAVLILVAVTRPEGPLARVLRVRPLVYLGRISYSLYLWHLIALELAWRGLDAPTELGILMGLGAAAASYHFVEQPFLRRKRRRREALERRDEQAVSF
jgi:peptidoglycan/LPS O-acetylase OafA/YrhL